VQGFGKARGGIRQEPFQGVGKKGFVIAYRRFQHGTQYSGNGPGGLGSTLCRVIGILCRKSGAGRRYTGRKLMLKEQNHAKDK
jgi:hypothetical protein